MDKEKDGKSSQIRHRAQSLSLDRNSEVLGLSDSYLVQICVVLRAFRLIVSASDMLIVRGIVRGA